MATFIFELITLALLIYSIEFTIAAREKYQQSYDKKMQQVYEQLFTPVRIERYTCPIEIIEVKFMIDPYSSLIRNDAEYKKRFFEREMRNAKMKLFNKIMECNQFLEIKTDEDHKLYTGQEIYTLTLRVANILKSSTYYG